MKNPASTASVNTVVDMVTDYTFFDANGLPQQEKKYYDGSSTAVATTYTYE